jgi:hypothetical protein
MYLFTFALTGLQHRHPELRSHLAQSWALAQKWRQLEPSAHRLPIPEALYRAIVAVAIAWGWERFAAAVVCAYQGAARIGEILRLLRAHVLLPADTLLTPDVPKVFLTIAQPKSRYRGGAFVQHAVVDSVPEARFLERVLLPLQPSERLCHLSPGAFRTRWDAVLRALRVPPALGFLPGGLRGGGAVHYYTSGVPIQNLMWRMRLRHQVTLEHYLQEVAGSVSLRAAPLSAQARIRDLAPMYRSMLDLHGDIRRAPA